VSTVENGKSEVSAVGNNTSEETKGEENDGKFGTLNLMSFQFCYSVAIGKISDEKKRKTFKAQWYVY